MFQFFSRHFSIATFLRKLKIEKLTTEKFINCIFGRFINGFCLLFYKSSLFFISFNVFSLNEIGS